jgi:hypothetical protein
MDIITQIIGAACGAGIALLGLQVFRMYRDSMDA